MTGTSDEPEHHRDVKAMSRTQLREKYKLTYDSWKNMKQRAKRGALIDPLFDDFKTFLAHMGPRLDPGLSLDRLDHKNLTYGPGLCRWSDRKAQAVNRSSTRFIEIEGVVKPLTEWAAETEQAPTTVASRLTRGSSPERAVFPKGPLRLPNEFPKTGFPGPQDKDRLRKLYNEFLQQRIPGELREEFYVRSRRPFIAHGRQEQAKLRAKLAWLKDGTAENAEESDHYQETIFGNHSKPPTLEQAIESTSRAIRVWEDGLRDIERSCEAAEEASRYRRGLTSSRADSYDNWFTKIAFGDDWVEEQP